MRSKEREPNCQESDSSCTPATGRGSTGQQRRSLKEIADEFCGEDGRARPGESRGRDPNKHAEVKEVKRG